MHIQNASPRCPSGRPVLPAWMAVPLPCDPPRRPCPRPLDPANLRFPWDEPAIHCPQRRQPVQRPRPMRMGMLPC